jgi:putative inorganic carbon (HCO3(-)) transporter
MLYACLLLYVTLIYVRPAEIVPAWATIPFVDILTVISAIIAVFSVALKPRRLFDLPQDKLLLAFWATMMISSFKIWLSGVYMAFLAFMPVVFAYFLIRAGVQSPRQLRGLIYLLMALNVFLAVNGIVQYHTGVGLGNVGLVLDRIYGTGIFNDPNDLGMTFVMSVPLFLFAVGRAGTGFVTRALSLAGLCAVLLALYYTNSRGAIVGLAAAMVCLALLRYKTMAGTIAAVALLGVIAVAAPSRGSEMDAGESSAQSRIQSWAEGWNMLKSHPLTGVGFDQYLDHHIRVAHNSFVHTFAALGLIGAF